MYVCMYVCKVARDSNVCLGNEAVNPNAPEVTLWTLVYCDVHTWDHIKEPSTFKGLQFHEQRVRARIISKRRARRQWMH